MQNDPGSSHMFLRPVTISDDRFQANTVIGRNKGTDILGQDKSIAYPTTNVNLLNASVH
jgi:hypothetical protein